jgi:gamma-glutamylcyclotransferase (GGCT)/AIG2-like uncharacterized protein YtfP
MEYLPLFVYGSLREGFANYNHYLRGKVVDIVPGVIKGQMYDVGAFPAVVCGKGTVHGELMYINLADYVNTMRKCDGLEGYNPDSDYNLYCRKNIVVKAKDGTYVKAWVYIWECSAHHYPQVIGGDWLKYYMEKHQVQSC